MKTPNPDDSVTITYAELEEIMAESAVKLADTFYESSHNDNKWKKLILDVTALYAGDIVKKLFGKKEEN